MLRLYVSFLNEPSSALMFLAENCVKVFSDLVRHETEQHIYLRIQKLFHLGSKNNEIVKRESPTCSIVKYSKNAGFAYPENILSVMFGDNDNDIRNLAISQI